MAGTRYFRYLLFAFLCICIVFFFSSSSAPVEQIKSTTGRIKEWGGQLPVKHPSNGYKPPAQDVKEEVTYEDESSDDDAGSKSTVTPGGDQQSSAPSATPAADASHQTADNGASAASPSPNMDTPENAAAVTSDSGPPKSKATDGPSHGGRPKMNATFVTLARNGDVWDLAKSIRHVEDRFNHEYHYDWVFLNDEPFDDNFKKVTTNLVSGKTKYGLIPKEHWSIPSWIDKDQAKKARERMEKAQVIYGGSESYRHMCRFESGFFFRQELMMDYEWYWRVEPSVRYQCDINYDPFKFMADNKKKYGFVLSLLEYQETIPTLWESVKKFIDAHPEHISSDNSMEFVSEDGGRTYNLCHFWSNFEVGNLDWLRSQAYLDFFDHLDHEGGFFYERWGDAPVHSIAAALLLKKDEIHFFEDIAYWHVPFLHCPNDEQERLDRKCSCNPSENFDWNGYSCTNKYYEVKGKTKPDEAQDN